MDLKKLALVALLLLAAAVGWRLVNSGLIKDWLATRSDRPLNIPFDNGTVRQYEAASQPAAQAAKPAVVPGGIRKCRHRGEITYTNGACPPGAVEQGLAGGTVSVVSGQGQPKPAPTQAPAPKRASLNDVLDRSEEMSLRDKRIEQAVNGPPK